ncbi:LacI family DNA-binding transcriptional regulator [Stagnihabitans tardus]|uniref:Substrate-binding domain-containing protein n=1 Tax=Stagnihabitans tardus TaxID=2699202 RepID=A0AAE4YCK5_9RHOB|nr:LacI family DNA-binding transcriptional regulator [Stagnihabitans tardus]NBZ87165.1 substrate-binding domain-containing protein [Stagnihabitans tardus]
MRATLTDISREAGVSPATVDRVLNERPGVKEHTRAHVLAVARRLGYIDRATPTLRLAFLLPQGTNTFIQMLRAQIEAQAPEGVATRVETFEGFDPSALAARIAGLRGTVDGLGVIALDHPLVREAIRGLCASGVKVVTLCSDIQSTPRIAYIGTDNAQAGRLAGHVLGRFLGGQGKVALMAGSLSYRGHQEREMGFRQVLHEDFPELQVVELREMLDDREKARAETLALIDRHPDLAAIYNVGAGSYGIGQALKDRRLAGKIVLIGHEATPGNKAMLLDGTMDAVIDQNPRVEAREALACLTAALRGEAYTPIPPRQHIIFRENIPED